MKTSCAAMTMIHLYIILTVLLMTVRAHSIPRNRIPNHNARNVMFTTETIQIPMSHDPLENRGVSLQNVHLTEGDIRQRPPPPPLPNFGQSETARGASYGGGYGGGAGHGGGLGGGNSESRPSGDELRALTPRHQLRLAVPFAEQTWTDRIIPYVVDSNFTLDVLWKYIIESQSDSSITTTYYNIDKTELTCIHQALTELMEGSGSCITFVPRQDQQDFVYITGRLQGCWSDVGRQGGNQTVSVSSLSHCVTKGIVMHELMHSLGFWHEHNRKDRDRYIQILRNNIITESLEDFDIKKGARLNNVSYDYYSLMHYSTTMFSKDASSLKSIEILDPSVTMDEVGQRKYLSEKDKQRIRALYNCPLTKCSYPQTMNNGYVTVKNTTVGSIVKYSCSNSTFILIGASERMCMYDGAWSGSTPLCLSSQSVLAYCNFELPGICGWSQDVTDDMDWTRSCSQTPSEHTGPIVDHTVQSPDGYYMYLEGTHVSPNSTARLTSPVYQEAANMSILFWYNMYGAGMGTLKVYIKFDDGSMKELGSVSGNQNIGWKMEHKYFTASVPFQIVFEGVRGPLDSSDMAIDDVIIGSSQNVAMYENAVIRELKEDIHSCDFDNNLCGWSQNDTGQIKWFRNSGPTATINTGPDCDMHDCQNGSYVYTEASHSRTAGETARIASPVFQVTGQVCIMFNYHMYGREVGNLTLYVSYDNSSFPVWSASGNCCNSWLSAQVDTLVLDEFQIVMEASSGNGIHGDIAFDDVRIMRGKCHAVIKCDFDQRLLCDLYNEIAEDDFDWSFASGTYSNGPAHDHTYGQGYFVYIEASAPRIAGEKAQLVTPYLYPSQTGYCVTFWYYMHGQDVASLTVTLRDEGGIRNNLWTRGGNQGAMWSKANIQIPNINSNFQVIFEAKVGTTYASDIALDDLFITEDICQ